MKWNGVSCLNICESSVLPSTYTGWGKPRNILNRITGTLTKTHNWTILLLVLDKTKL